MPDHEAGYADGFGADRIVSRHAELAGGLNAANAREAIDFSSFTRS